MTDNLTPEAMAHMLGIAVSKAEHFLKTFHVSAQRPSPWTCAARKQALPEPAERNWPVCGCDPYADKVISALEESGHFTTPPQAVKVAEGDGGAQLAIEALKLFMRNSPENYYVPVAGRDYTEADWCPHCSVRHEHHLDGHQDDCPYVKGRAALLALSLSRPQGGCR